MNSISIWHLLVVLLAFASSIMGVVRGVTNRSVLNAIISVIIPYYGLAYFFIANRKTNDIFKSTSGSSNMTRPHIDAITEIERLTHLRTSGALSESEFEEMKAQLLSGSARG